MHLIPLPIVGLVLAVAFIAYVIGFWVGRDSVNDPELNKTIKNIFDSAGE